MSFELEATSNPDATEAIHARRDRGRMHPSGEGKGAIGCQMEVERSRVADEVVGHAGCCPPGAIQLKTEHG
jgi:hypothetical protein